MANSPSAKSLAWAIFDRIVADASAHGYSNPWVRDKDGSVIYQPDFAVLSSLLGVPLHLRAKTTTGVPALALDVWVAYELRRAGFAPNAVWPRAEPPRVLPAAIGNLLDVLPKKESKPIAERIYSGKPLKDVVASSANILGKNYVKQVDVVISDWSTGPELMVSTKRMDSSFGNNAANRVEESYGDAKNLRLRHPMAALGFVYGLRSTILTEAPDKAEWLIDLLGKLGHEDDAYHAVALLMLDYDKTLVPEDAEADDEKPLADAGLEPADDEEDLEPVDEDEVRATIASLPMVRLLHHEVPKELQPSEFLGSMVTRVLRNSPVNFHTEARRRYRDA